MGLAGVELAGVGLAKVGLVGIGLAKVGLAGVGLAEVGLVGVELAGVGLAWVGLAGVAVRSEQTSCHSDQLASAATLVYTSYISNIRPKNLLIKHQYRRAALSDDNRPQLRIHRTQWTATNITQQSQST